MKKFVAGLQSTELREIVRTFEQLEEIGHIGDEAIRTYARTYMEQLGTKEAIARWMNILALESYRELYYRAIRPVGVHAELGRSAAVRK